jgi:hypothetical protein
MICKIGTRGDFMKRHFAASVLVLLIPLVSSALDCYQLTTPIENDGDRVDAICFEETSPDFGAGYSVFAAAIYPVGSTPKKENQAVKVIQKFVIPSFSDDTLNPRVGVMKPVFPPNGLDRYALSLNIFASPSDKFGEITLTDEDANIRTLELKSYFSGENRVGGAGQPSTFNLIKALSLVCSAAARGGAF